MSHGIQQFDNYISSSTLDLILSEALNATEEQWALFNEPVNGPFWDNKRLITNQANASELNKKNNAMFDGKYEATIPNKAQRFFFNDTLGPFMDVHFNKKIKHGSILFLNDVGYIEFPDMNIKIFAEKARAVFYPSNINYKIVCDNKDPMYFITVFFTEV
jgi:hypothetical protein